MKFVRKLMVALVVCLSLVSMTDAGHAGVFQDAMKAFENRLYSKSFELLLPLAKKGDADAQYKIGGQYHFGQGVKKDYEKALFWYSKAAEQGHARAQFSVGAAYDNGRAVVKDDAEAVKWYRKSAENGYSEGQYNLGTAYLFGNGVSKNYAEAEKWLLKAADRRYAASALSLMRCARADALCDVGKGCKQGYGKCRISPDQAGP